MNLAVCSIIYTPVVVVNWSQLTLPCLEAIVLGAPTLALLHWSVIALLKNKNDKKHDNKLLIVQDEAVNQPKQP